MSTLKEIALRAGVSIPTVSRVLRGHAKETWPGMAKRAGAIRDIAAELNFRPSSAARAMRSNRTHQIGVLVRNSSENNLQLFTDMAGYEFILGINQQLETADYVLSFIRFDDIVSTEQPLLQSRAFRENMLDGIIALGHIPQFVSEKFAGQNCLWVNSNMWWPERCVRRDDLHAGRTVAQKLMEMNYQRLVWVDQILCDGSDHYSTQQRLQGVSEVARARGVELTTLRCPLTTTPSDRRNFKRLLQPNTALVAYNSSVANKINHAGIELNRLAGKHYGLASCDNERGAANDWPGLSCMNFDRFALGQKAAQMMLKLTENPAAECPSLLVKDAWISGSTTKTYSPRG